LPTGGIERCRVDAGSCLNKSAWGIGMSDWNPELYLKYGTERTQPSIDLINRVHPFAMSIRNLRHDFCIVFPLKAIFYKKFASILSAKLLKGLLCLG
jgi:hypothetical protein